MVMTDVAGGTSMKKKTSKGRKKIEIKKIEETNSRQVAFSKRRAGLFKKASELCVLTGAQIAILVNSPGGRVFTFGHPNVDLLVDRYLKDKNKDTAGSDAGASQNSPPPLPMSQFNQHYVEVSRELEIEKKRRETIPVPWYEEPVDGMKVEELEQYLCSLEELKKKVVTRADELMMIKKSPALLGTNLFEMGWNNNIQMLDTATNTKNSPALLGTNVLEMGWNDIIQMLDIATNTKNSSALLGTNVFEREWNNNIQMDIPSNTKNSPALLRTNVFEMGWNNNIQTDIPSHTKNSPALLGTNEFEMGWNNNIQTVDIPTNTTVHGGLNFHHDGEVGNF